MKQILLSVLVYSVIITRAWADVDYPGDTIVINFGNNTRIMVLVNNRNDLKQLKNYDINAMLKALSMSVDTMNSGNKYLRIEDSTGTKYLKDTTIVVQNRTESRDNKEYDSKYNEWSREMNSKKKNKDKDEDSDSRKEKRHDNRGTRNYFNFDFGMNNYLENGKFPDNSNELYTVKPWGSWFVGINNTNRTHIGGPLFLDWGAGVNWYNFKFQNTSTRFSKTDMGTVIYNDTTITDPLKSKLTVTYINAYFVPIFNFGHSGRKRDIFHWGNYDNALRFGAGGYIGYRIDSYTKNQWNENDKKRSVNNHDSFYINNVRYGIRFRFGFQSFDFFADYDVSELFAEGKGPKLNPFSFGIIF